MISAKTYVFEPSHVLYIKLDGYPGNFSDEAIKVSFTETYRLAMEKLNQAMLEVFVKGIEYEVRRWSKTSS